MNVFRSSCVHAVFVNVLRYCVSLCIRACVHLVVVLLCCSVVIVVTLFVMFVVIVFGCAVVRLFRRSCAIVC